MIFPDDIYLAGTVHTCVLVRSEETEGRFSVIENSLPPLWEGPPLHRHDFDEAFYVLEGELIIQVGDEVFSRPRGGVAFAPRGVPHAYANPRGRPATYLAAYSPAGFERYYDGIAASQAGSEPPPAALKEIPEVTCVGDPIPRSRVFANATDADWSYDRAPTKGANSGPRRSRSDDSK